MEVSNGKSNRNSIESKIQRTHSIHLANGNQTNGGTNTNGHTVSISNGTDKNHQQQQQQQQQQNGGNYGSNLTNGNNNNNNHSISVKQQHNSLNKENEQLDNRKSDNNTKKFAFLSQPTIPDYRPQTVSKQGLILRILIVNSTHFSPSPFADYREKPENVHQPEYKVSPAAGNLWAADDQPQGHCQPAEQSAQQLAQQLPQQLAGKH